MMNLEKIAEKHSHIKSWGIDADLENEPTYPMKKYTGDDHRRMKYDRPEHQKHSVEILKSNERPGLSAVYGTSTPPSGLSGVIRRYAFRHSEGSWDHWLPLILADRVNAIEGIVDDLSRGHIPNFFKERGWTAEWKYNRKSVIQKVAIGLAVTSVLVTVLALRKKNRIRKQIA